MTNFLSTIQQNILDICVTSLGIKLEMSKKNEGAFRCYVGGGRQFHPQEESPYSRTIYLGRGSKRYDTVPEDIIDLNEVYSLYKRKNKIIDWEDHPYHSSFEEAVRHLFKKGYFLALEVKDIISGNDNTQSYSEDWSVDQTQDASAQHSKVLRFIKLNPEFLPDINKS